MEPPDAALLALKVDFVGIHVARCDWAVKTSVKLLLRDDAAAVHTLKRGGREMEDQDRKQRQSTMQIYSPSCGRQSPRPENSYHDVRFLDIGQTGVVVNVRHVDGDLALLLGGMRREDDAAVTPGPPHIFKSQQCHVEADARASLPDLWRGKAGEGRENLDATFEIQIQLPPSNLAAVARAEAGDKRDP